MTRQESRMIAEELYKLMRKDIARMHDAVREQQEEWLSSAEAARYLGVSVAYLKKNIDDIPHTKVGRLNKFKKSSLYQYINR